MYEQDRIEPKDLLEREGGRPAGEWTGPAVSSPTGADGGGGGGLLDRIGRAVKDAGIGRPFTGPLFSHWSD